MKIGKRVAMIIICGAGLMISACGPVKKTISTPIDTFTPTSTHTSTPTLSLTPTLNSTLTPTNTLTLTPTILAMSASTETAAANPAPSISIPGLPSVPGVPTGPACVATGPETCQTQSTTLPLLGTCSVTICTDSCGNITSSSTGSCK